MLNQHLMSVNGKFEQIGRDDLLAVADRFAIPSAKRSIEDVNDAIDAWPEFAMRAELDAASIDEVGRELRRL